MNKFICAGAACLTVIGCIPPPDDGGDQITEDRSFLSVGQDQGHFLVLPPLLFPDEVDRRADTDLYYKNVRIGADGKSGGTIASALATLTAFRTVYRMNGNEENTLYYNRGDLGLGRNMHCVDWLSEDGQIACYVSNYVAGTGEFAFGESSNIGLDNVLLDTNHPFATVAMVYRNRASSNNRIFFVVYDANGKLQNFAALDRHGLLFAQEFDRLGKTKNPDSSKFGTPGGTLNLHVPSNCVSCHGGRYFPGPHASVVQALFLPFDLDQFDYDDRFEGAFSRAAQEGALKRQNQMVRKVASVSGAIIGSRIVDQLDGWYHNTHKTTDKTETFENDFDSSFVPSGWADQPQMYQEVVRGSCRTCHVTTLGASGFDTEADFRHDVGTAVTELCGKAMPHSLQSFRLFWQSTRPQIFAQYLRDIGKPDLATKLEGCGGGDAASLDPPLIMASDTTTLL
jgi:mono/diheme cytochrome c family protein